MSVTSVFNNPSDLIKKVRYENEKSRYVLALVGITPIILFFVALIIVTKGVAIPIIIAYGLLFWFLLWFTGKVAKAALLMNLVEVSEYNFDKLHGLIINAKETLKYTKKINSYVWPGSTVGLSILHLLDRKIFLIQSAFLEDNPSDKVLDYSVMFHVARLKTKSEYFTLLTKMISGLEKLFLLNILLYPFERATVYTADRVAMIYSGKPDYAQQAFSREMVGTELAENMNLDRIAKQGTQCQGFFAWVARAYLPFPGYSHRFLELNKFSNSEHDVMIERHRL